MPALEQTEVEIRLLKLEVAIAQLWTLLGGVINEEQFNRLNILRQKEVALMEARLALLETQIARFQEAYNNLL